MRECLFLLLRAGGLTIQIMSCFVSSSAASASVGGVSLCGSAEGDREQSGYDMALQLKQYAIPSIRSSFKKHKQ